MKGSRKNQRGHKESETREYRTRNYKIKGQKSAAIEKASGNRETETME